MTPNTWAMICHLSSFVGYFGNGLGSIVAPLVVWLVKKDQLPEVDEHGKEALNFNISLLIYAVALAVLCFLTLGIGLLVAAPLLLAMVVFHAVCTIMAAVKANNGEFFHYPLTIRLIK